VRRAILVLLALAALAAAVWFLTGRSATPEPPPTSTSRSTAAHAASDADPARTHPSRRTDAAAPPASPATGAAPTADVASGLRVALASGDADRTRAAAAALRLALRTDPAAWDEAVRRLLDPREDATLRAALAFVLGTIDAPRTDAVLLDALRSVEAPGAPEDLRRAIVLALGATREPADKDDVFAFGDRPWGEDGPGGLGITVRRRIDDPATRAALAGALRASPVEIRRVAAVALRHSLGSPDTLENFTAALRDEKDDAPVAVVGETLAAWARISPSMEERDRLLRAIFARTSDETLDGLRFRVTDDLGGVLLPQDVTDSLHALAVSDRPFGLRSFALDVLVGSAAAPGRLAEGEVRRTRDLLARTLEGATDPALRDLAARHLRRLPADPAAAAALLHAVRTDPAWNVRYTALETIVRLGGADVAAALAAGKEDGDERVRALAAELSSGK
jgi:HEAT repeat protein